MTDAPLILWFRRDLRLADNPMVAAAAATGRPLVPAFVHDGVVEETPTAPKWRWGLGVERFGEALEAAGSRLVLRRGRAAEALLGLARETGAAGVWWSRLYGPEARERDEAVSDRLGAEGIEARDFEGQLLFEPRAVRTGTGGPYRVFTPFWRAVKDRDVPRPEPAPRALRPPEAWPESESVAAWEMERAMRGGAGVVAGHLVVGEAAARERLAAFLAGPVRRYPSARERPAASGTSGLSENLSYGEIGPRTCWHEGRAAAEEDGAPRPGSRRWPGASSPTTCSTRRPACPSAPGSPTGPSSPGARTTRTRRPGGAGAPGSASWTRPCASSTPRGGSTTAPA